MRLGKLFLLHVTSSMMALQAVLTLRSLCSDGAKSEDGYSIVLVQATGHHTGTAFALPGLPPVSKPCT